MISASWIIRIIQIIFGIIILGVAAGGATHVSETPLNYLVFVGAWVLLVLIYVLIIAVVQSFRFPVILIALEALTIFFLLIGIIVLPATLFNTSDSGRNRCRLVLSGESGLNGEALSDARMGCQCVLAAVIFDGLSVFLWVASLILVIVAWRRTK